MRFADATGEISVEALLEANPDLFIIRVNILGTRSRRKPKRGSEANDVTFKSD